MGRGWISRPRSRGRASRRSRKRAKQLVSSPSCEGRPSAGGEDRSGLKNSGSGSMARRSECATRRSICLDCCLNRSARQIASTAVISNRNCVPGRPRRQRCRSPRIHPQSSALSCHRSRRSGGCTPPRRPRELDSFSNNQEGLTRTQVCRVGQAVRIRCRHPVTSRDVTRRMDRGFFRAMPHSSQRQFRKSGIANVLVNLTISEPAGLLLRSRS